MDPVSDPPYVKASLETRKALRSFFFLIEFELEQINFCHRSFASFYRSILQTYLEFLTQR